MVHVTPLHPACDTPEKCKMSIYHKPLELEVCFWCVKMQEAQSLFYAF